MSASRRCSTCGVSWPGEDITLSDGSTETFERCPHCKQRTWSSQSEPDMTVDEAASEIASVRFEEFLVKREEQDAALLRRVDPQAFAQYLMDAAEEQITADEHD